MDYYLDNTKVFKALGDPKKSDDRRYAFLRGTLCLQDSGEV